MSRLPAGPYSSGSLHSVGLNLPLVLLGKEGWPIFFDPCYKACSYHRISIVKLYMHVLGTLCH